MSGQHFTSTRRPAVWLSVAAMIGSLVCLGGCSSHPDWQADAYPAFGTVRINGEVAIDAVVIFHSLSGDVDVRKSEPWGIVNGDGLYRISTYGVEDGAPLGEYAVTLTWPKDPRNPHGSDRLKNKFSSQEKAPLVVTITRGTNELPPIELNDVKLR